MPISLLQKIKTFPQYDNKSTDCTLLKNLENIMDLLFFLFMLSTAQTKFAYTV